MRTRQGPEHRGVAPPREERAERRATQHPQEMSDTLTPVPADRRARPGAIDSRVDPHEPPAAAAQARAARAAAHLAGAVRFRTVQTTGGTASDPAEFAGLRRFLEESYPRVHASLRRELIDGAALLYTWEPQRAEAPPALLLAHHDVVPVDPGTERTWSHPPFAGTIADGFVWGRGALDDKAALIAILDAVETLLEEGLAPRRSVLIASGPDEEVGGFGGACRVAERVRSMGIRPEYVLDEGLLVTDGILPGIRAPVALVGVAEKGNATVVLEARGAAGHASMPPRRTAAGRLARAIARIEQNPFPSALGGAARGMLRALAPAVAPPVRWLLSCPGPLEPLVRALLALAPETNALVRTTVATTVIAAGVKENVLPDTARATLDVRVIPGDGVDAVVRRLRDIVADDSVEVRLLPGAAEPSAISSTSSAAYVALERAVARAHPDALIAPSLVLAATDSRHFRGLAGDVYHFRPWRLTRGEIARIHGIDERIRVDDLGRGVEFFRDVLRA